MRFRSPLLVLAIALVASWYWMQIVHELGQAVGALATSGKVRDVHLPLIGFSYTDVSPNPHPWLVAWAGPILGAAIPAAAWTIAALIARTIARGSIIAHTLAYVLAIFAGFCLIANGAYIGVGSLHAIGDAGDLLNLGSPPWSLWLFGLLCVPTGFVIWHAAGRQPVTAAGRAHRHLLAAAGGALLSGLSIALLV